MALDNVDDDLVDEALENINMNKICYTYISVALEQIYRLCHAKKLLKYVRCDDVLHIRFYENFSG